MKPGQVVRKFRKEQKMTLASLANCISIDPGNLSRIERGELNIGFNLLEKLSSVLHISPIVFFDKDSSYRNSSLESKEFIQNFRLSAKFINQFNNKTFVIALGGEVFDENQFKAIAYDINLLYSMNINIILVHGIRPQIDNKLRGNIKEAELVRNIRVTKKEMINDIVEVNGSIKTNIESKVLDSIFKKNKSYSFLKKNNPFNTLDFESERNRLNKLFKNSGVYNFQINSISFELKMDTTAIDLSIPVTINILDNKTKNDLSNYKLEYKLHYIKKINVYTNGVEKFKNNDLIAEEVFPKK